MTETNGNGQARRTNRVVQPIAPPPTEVLQAELDRLLESNKKKMADLAAQGTPVDPLSFLHARIDALINSIASASGPSGPRWALNARLSFEQYVDKEIEGAESMGRRMNLAAGAQFTPSMIADLARADRTLHRRAG